MRYIILLVFLCLISVAFSQNQTMSWQITQTFVGGCSGNQLYYGASLVSNCNQSSCSCADGICQTIDCCASPPTIQNASFVDAIGYVFYYDSKCSNIASINMFRDSFVAPGDKCCVPLSLDGPYSTAACYSTSSQIGVCYTNFSDSACKIQVGAMQPVAGCTQYGNLYVNKVGCTCFHESTRIEYNRKIYAINELVKGEEKSCRVPHIVVSDGIKIQTSCKETLRLTERHLVYSQRGLIEAQTLVVGDILSRSPTNKTMHR